MNIARMTLTGFADEISSDLEEQLDVLESESIRYLELRGVLGKNVLDLTDEEAERVKKRLQQRRFGVSSIGSPLGKIGIGEAFEPHVQRARRAVELARFFEAPFVRIFSFYIPKGEHEQHREEALRRMKRLAELAESAGVVMVHENESHIYGDTAERCLELLESAASDRLRAAFDPANFVQCGVRPMDDAYPLLSGYIAYVHVKDAVMGSGQVTPVGEGDGQWSELLARLRGQGYAGFLSLEPHLPARGEWEGKSGAERFVIASRALKKELEAHGIDWS